MTSSSIDAGFVGRDDDDQVVEGFFALGVRLVTVHGLGGMGKTRFARHFAASRLQPSMTTASTTFGEVWFCDLSEAQSHTDVLTQMTALFEVSVESEADDDADASERLASWTLRIGEAIARRGRLLVVMDNFERVVNSARATIGTWLALAPEVRFLVTSREVLGIDGEARHELPPLSDDEAVTLFLERLRRLPQALSVDERALVGEIVRRVDAIPLAVELAASRAGVVGLAELRDRLASHIAWLRTTRRDVDVRQSTMTSVIDWSWELLSSQEQAALAELAVFRGGFTLASAEAVLSRYEGVETVELIERLRLKSLVRVFEGNEAGLRLGLFDVLREYALTKLTLGGTRHTIEARHAAHMLSLCRNAAEELLADEVHNLTLAHAWLVAHDPPRSVGVLLRLRHYLLYSGSVDAYLALIDASLASVDQLTDDHAAQRALALALRLRGEVSRVRFRYQESLVDLHRALAIVGPIDDRLLEAQIRCAAGVAEWQLGHDTEAARQGQTALALAQALGAPAEEGQARSLLGTVAWVRGDAAAMVEHFERALWLARQTEQPTGAVIVLILYASGTHERGRVERARELFAEALALSHDADDRRHRAAALSALGQIAFELGDDVQARAHCDAALALAHQLGSHRHEAMALARLGVLHLYRGELEMARAHFEHAERLVSIAADRRLGLYRGWLAATLAMLGRIDEALELFAAAQDHAERVRDPGVTAALALLKGFLHLRAAETASDDETRQRALEVVESLLIEVRAIAQPHPGASLSVVRVLAECQRRVQDSVSVVLPSAPAPITLRVGEQGRWFEADGGLQIDLTRRRALRLILLELVTFHFVEPEGGLSIERLFLVGWPGEKAGPLAAARRVYTAVGMLRDLGLRNILIRRDDGYLVEPSIVVTRLP